MTEPSDTNWEGAAVRECGEHRTVGPHRAWCHDCSEWCYPASLCKGCEVERINRLLQSIDPAKLREAAAWFDTVDRLIASIKVIPTEGETYDLIQSIGKGRQIQDDLREIATLLEEMGDVG